MGKGKKHGNIEQKIEHLLEKIKVLQDELSQTSEEELSSRSTCSSLSLAKEKNVLPSFSAVDKLIDSLEVTPAQIEAAREERLRRQRKKNSSNAEVQLVYNLLKEFGFDEPRLAALISPAEDTVLYDFYLIILQDFDPAIREDISFLSQIKKIIEKRMEEELRINEYPIPESFAKKLAVYKSLQVGC